MGIFDKLCALEAEAVCNLHNELSMVLNHVLHKRPFPFPFQLYTNTLKRVISYVRMFFFIGVLVLYSCLRYITLRGSFTLQDLITVNIPQIY